MIFSEKIVYSEKIKNNRDFQKIIDTIQSNEPIFQIFLIVINKKSENLFEIMSANEMTKNFHNVKDFIVVGIAHGRGDAFLLFENLMKRYYEEKGDLDNIKEYFASNVSSV